MVKRLFANPLKKSIMKKFYIEPKTVYIDLCLEEPINAVSDPDARGEIGDEGDYTKKQGSSDIWKDWSSDSDK